LDVKTSTASDFRGLRADSRPQPPKIIDRLRESSRLVTTATTTRKCEKKEEFLKRASNTARDIYQTHLQAGFRHGGVHANGGGATESERHVYFILRSKVVVCVIVMATAWHPLSAFFFPQMEAKKLIKIPRCMKLVFSWVFARDKK
tara:strand:+ start:177 stop:614 length:438 start_codon:yes stop_codon:yes gene_type:complete